MPANLPVGNTVLSSPNVVLEQPELAARIAAVITNWTLIEGDLLQIYALIMGDYLEPHKPPPGMFVSPPAHPVAYQVFNEVNSLSSRLNLLMSLCEWRLGREDFTHFKSAFYEKIRKRSRERNAVAHGSQGTCAKFPDSLILSLPFQHPQIWRKRDFEAISQRIIELHLELGQFVNKVYRPRYLRANPRATDW